MTAPVPTEEAEQIEAVQLLEDLGLKFTAIPNNTFTKYHSQKQKNYRTGLRRGFPDMVVLIPPDRSRDGQGYFLCIEMKRQKRGVLSPDQQKWIDAINELGTLQVQAYVCEGFKSFQKVLDHYVDTNIYITF